MAESETEESPEDNLCRQSHWHGLSQAVAVLPPVLRQTVTLRYYHEYTYQAIGDRMGCSESTVKVRLSQARRRLGASLRRAERAG